MEPKSNLVDINFYQNFDINPYNYTESKYNI